MEFRFFCVCVILFQWRNVNKSHIFAVYNIVYIKSWLQKSLVVVVVDVVVLGRKAAKYLSKTKVNYE